MSKESEVARLQAITDKKVAEVQAAILSGDIGIADKKVKELEKGYRAVKAYSEGKGTGGENRFRIGKDEIIQKASFDTELAASKLLVLKTALKKLSKLYEDEEWNFPAKDL